jgi:glycosyltransferase involved in cell wall biosynthesis
VTNGYDPQLDAAAELATLPPLPEDRRLIVHTGALSGPRGRDARPLLEALQRLLDEPEVGSRLLLVQAGPTLPADEPLLAVLRKRGLALTFGVVPRPVAIALQRRAAVLVLLTSDEVSQSTGKLYEYLAAGRPILALAAENEAARIVKETVTGVSVPPDDVDAIAAALRSAAAGELELSYAPRGVERYTYPAPANAMATVVEGAIGHRRTALGGRM